MTPDPSDGPESAAAGGRRVAVGLGSNVGDRPRHLAAGAAALSEHLEGVLFSRVYETEPVGVPDGHGPYLNMCCVGRTALGPSALLERLLAVERAAGRDRGEERAAPAPRTLDLDLLLYGDEVVDEGGLVVPHPRMRRRAFVLLPLAEVAGGWRDPETGRTVAELAGSVDASGVGPYRGELPDELEEVIAK